ncbi:MAG: ABC transporter permease, partial [Bacillota bacterium]
VLPKNSLLMNVCDQGGVVLHPAPTEAILTEATARHLGLHPGDTFQIQLPPSGSTVSAVVAALSGTSAGEMVTIMDGELAQGLGIGGFVNSLFLTIDPLERDAIRSQLGSLPSVARITTIETVRERFEELLGLTDVILIIFLLCGAILAGAILFNTTTLNILERRRELATMLTLGMPLFSLASVLTWESLLSGLAGLLIGWPIGMRMLRLIVASVESDILSLPYWIDGATVGLACSGIMIVLLLAQMPALRQVARMNVAEAAKSRE